MSTQVPQQPHSVFPPTDAPGSPRHRGHVLDLGDDRSSTLAHAGGKGASLAGLLRQGFPVPPGLVIASGAYDEFLQPALRSIRHLLATADDDGTHQASDLGRHVRRLLRPLNIPHRVEEALREALGRFPTGQGFAVRSSSTLEDLSGAAFAGMHETYLNCRGLPRLMEAIRDCYLSLWSERAVAYRDHKQFNHLESRMAVVIQPMVACEVAGVGFSVHPVTGDLRTMVINANQGLGDSVVNGEHAVDHIELDKATGEVTSAIPGQKETMVVCDEISGGIRQVGLEPSTAAALSLSPWQIGQLAAMILRVEEAAGFPQDTEWGIAGGAVHLFQARPITGIPPRWTRDESAERYPNVMTPLSWDLVDTGFHQSLSYSLALMGSPPFDGQWFASHDHYIYGNQNAVALYLGRPPISIHSLDELRAALPDLLHRYRWIQDLPVTWSRDLDGFLLQIGRLSAEPVEEWTDPRQIWEQVTEIARVGTEYFQPNIAISITQVQLHRVLSHLLTLVVGPARAPKLFDALMGFCETMTWQINRELHDLATLADQEPELKAMVLDQGSRDIIADGSLHRYPAFARQFDALLTAHGHREPELDAYHATWGEVPWIVLDHVRLILRSLECTPTPVEKEHTLRLRMLKAEATLFARVPGDLQFFFRELLRLTRLYTALDDHEHYQTTRLTPPLRRALRALGTQLVQSGILEEPMDVFFTRMTDLDEAVQRDNEEGWSALAESIRTSKEAYLRDARRRPDWVLGESPAATNPASSAARPTDLSGIPASAGTVEGAVCHVRSESDFASFPEGAILVARTTSPSWTPLFHAAAGVITESGGPLSHGAITAREMRIPAVMAVHDAIARLPAGQRIRLNGTTGVVALI